MRGGVSLKLNGFRYRFESSPHARGCFPARIIPRMSAIVFPACAGVFPQDLQGHHNLSRLPRMRGGVSLLVLYTPRLPSSSPHARGCFFRLRRIVSTYEVFPACAGVFLSIQIASQMHEGLPRMRGGVS